MYSCIPEVFLNSCISDVINIKTTIWATIELCQYLQCFVFSPKDLCFVKLLVGCYPELRKFASAPIEFSVHSWNLRNMLFQYLCFFLQFWIWCNICIISSGTFIYFSLFRPSFSNFTLFCCFVNFSKYSLLNAYYYYELR